MNRSLPPFQAFAQTDARRRSLRIAFVTESYPPEINGVANTVARVIDGLRSRSHHVQVVRPRQGSHDKGLCQEGPHDVLTGGMAIPMYGQLRLGFPSRRRLQALWQEQRPDVVHIATEGPLGWSALQAASRLRLPVCSDFRTNFQAYSKFYGLAWLKNPITAYLRNVHNLCHSTMVPTDALRLTLAREGFSPLSVVARGVDVALFAPEKKSLSLRSQWGVAEDDVVALYVGRLAAEKNLQLLLESFRNMRAACPRARLVIVGDGPIRKQLQSQCPDATFAGFQRGEDLAACYASSDMFLFPSLTETFGNVTAEAMASGLAVVAFDDAAAGQLIVHRGNGLLAPKDDPAQFVRLCTGLACDKALRERLGARARDTALTMGWENIVRNVEDQYATAMVRLRQGPLPRVWSQASGV